MKLYEQASELTAMNPLPDDAPEQLKALADEATGQEKQFIVFLFEALYAAATPEQLEKWQGE